MSEDRGFELVAERRFGETIASTLGGCEWPGCLLYLGCRTFPLLRAEARSFDLEAEERGFDLEAEERSFDLEAEVRSFDLEAE